MNKIFILCFIFSMLHDNSNIKVNDSGEAYINEKMRYSKPEITYYRDCRTGLCFAEIIQQGSIRGHACVPCDSVKAFLKHCN